MSVRQVQLWPQHYAELAVGSQQHAYSVPLTDGQHQVDASELVSS
jgi:hypothetical protein